MAEKKKQAVKVAGSVRPMRLPQVNQFLRQEGIEGVDLERGYGYFTFWGMPIHNWLNRVVVVDRLDALTLGEWLEKFRQLEKQNSQANPLMAKPAKKKSAKKKAK